MYLLAVTDGTTTIQVHSRRCPNQLDDRKLSCKCSFWFPVHSEGSPSRGSGLKEVREGSLDSLLSTNPLGAQLGF